MYLLGISGHQHGAAAAIVKDGCVVAAIEEEKLARIKHVGLYQCGGLPLQAIKFCLDKAGIGLDAVDCAVYYTQPRALLRRRILLSDRTEDRNASAIVDQSLSGVHEFRDRLKSIHRLRQLLKDSSKAMTVDHQLAHAASAFYPSGFERAALLVLSGRGDYVSIAVGVGNGKKIQILDRVLFPSSLGWIYSLITQYLGFSATGDEHKTQWLSLTGEPEFLPAFQNMIRTDKRGFPNIDSTYFDFSPRGVDPFTKRFYEKFGDQLRAKNRNPQTWSESAVWKDAIRDSMGFIPLSSEATTETYRRNLACSLQQRMETVVLELAESIRQRLQIDSLCLAGGVCLNSLLVARLERESGFRQVFVQPAAGNAGCSVGGPLYLWHKRSDTSQTEPWQHVFLGPEYSDDDVKSVLDNCKLPYRHINTADKLVSVVAELLSQGKIVAWFQGRTEFGGRSLGARSILANPQQEYIQENLNVYIKHREVFRPFAASVPEELAYDYFEGCGPLSRFLLSVSHIRESQRHQMPGAWFANGLARVHTVSRDSNPLFWRLLHKFGEKAGVPILLNTSFNLFGEPLVCSPRDAVRSYSCSGIDALVIRQFLLEKWGDAAGVLS